MIARKIGLDYVRALAILLVLICHFSSFYGGYTHQVYPLGVLGVELFFALSGYLIGGILLRRLNSDELISIKSIAIFWSRRWLRTIPLYLLFIPVYSWLEMRITWADLPRYLVFMQNFAWRPSGGFGISWSLAVEEWFYLLLPLVVLMFAWIVRNNHRSFIFAVMLFAVFPLFLRLLFAHGMLWDREVRNVVVFRLDAVMPGVMISYIEQFHRNIFDQVKSKKGFVSGLALLISSTLYVAWRYNSPPAKDFTSGRLDLISLTMMDIGGALILPCLKQFSGTIKLLDQPITCISLWSYSIYLVHRPVMMFFGRRVDFLDRAHQYLLPMLTITLTFMISAGLFYLFEKPILRLRDRWIQERRPINES